MNILRELKRPAIIITLGVYVLSAVLIILLVSQVASFSRKVTDFYAPTIYSVKSFADTVNHVQIHMEKKEGLGESTLHMLRESATNLRNVTISWKPAYRKHIEGMLLKADSFLASMENKNVPQEKLLADIRELNTAAMEYAAMHDAELANAKSGIMRSALRIRIAALFLLVIGIVVSFREIQIHRLKQREQERLSAMKALVSALDARDPYTKGHSTRVADYAVIIGKDMGFEKNALDHLYMAGLMHDVGKIAVPDEILRKEGRLSDTEWKEMRKHPVVSAQILQDFESIREIVPWVLYHHERFDGKGYPEGKAGSEIPLCAQILAVCDSFDAMTSSRPYRPGMDLGKALVEIQANKGTQWSEEVVDTFMKCIRKGLIILEEIARNRTQTAQVLGISRKTLQNKLKEYGLEEK